MRKAARGKMRLELEMNEVRTKHRSISIDEVHLWTSYVPYYSAARKEEKSFMQGGCKE